ncbi:MAG: hypothetical protein JWN41_958 [Thermoleophilia bacterium]|nr:hypothetical protein [Thermoleophilia bacterium]
MTDATPAAIVDAPIREVTVERTFDAARELVWQAWVDPEQFAHWFGAELEVPKETLDWAPRTNASWRANMLQDGAVLPFAGDFLEVVPPSGLVISFDGKYSDPPVDEIQTLTVTLTQPEAGSTHIALHQVGPMPDGMQEGLTHGYNSFMDRLQTLLPTK